MLGYLVQWFGVTLTVVVSVAAFWKGGREEQMAAAGLLLSFAMTLALRDWSWVGIQWGAFASDVAVLVLMTWIAVRSERFWPLFAAAFQLLCVFTHIARIVDPRVPAWAYATAQVIWSQWVFYAVGAGAWNSWRRSRQPAISERPSTAPGATRR